MSLEILHNNTLLPEHGFLCNTERKLANNV